MPFDWVNTETGEVRNGSCRSVRCPVCGEREVRLRTVALAAAKPERFVTLSDLPLDYRAALKEEARILHALRRRGYVVEWAIVHELTKSGLRHAHALQHGSYIPQAVLQEVSGRIPYISAIKGVHGAAGYAMKEAMRVTGYTTKGTGNLEAHLELNGGHVYRVTRGYFRGHTQREMRRVAWSSRRTT